MYSEFKIIKFQNQSQERKMIQHFEILIEKKKKIISELFLKFNLNFRTMLLRRCFITNNKEILPYKFLFEKGLLKSNLNKLK